MPTKLFGNLHVQKNIPELPMTRNLLKLVEDNVSQICALCILEVTSLKKLL